MTDKEATAIIRYALVILVGAVVAGGGVLLTQVTTGGVESVNWTPVLIATLGVLLTGCTSTLLPALRGEKIDADMLTPKQRKQIADELERRMKATPAGKAG